MIVDQRHRHLIHLSFLGAPAQLIRLSSLAVSTTCLAGTTLALALAIITNSGQDWRWESGLFRPNSRASWVRGNLDREPPPLRSVQAFPTESGPSFQASTSRRLILSRS
ncbi:hypothetical protein B0H12DRAFT_1108812 [Mycena haematopus]|nr:hypothetical protein B0H12DRAFT_1108812 [Mycena haematopus]